MEYSAMYMLGKRKSPDTRNHSRHGFSQWPILLRRLSLAEPITFYMCVMTSSYGNIFRVTGPLLGKPPVTGIFPSQRPVTRSFDLFVDLRLNLSVARTVQQVGQSNRLRLNKRLSKQPRYWWFKRNSHSLWRHCNDNKGHHTSSHFYLSISENCYKAK